MTLGLKQFAHTGHHAGHVQKQMENISIQYVAADTARLLRCTILRNTKCT